MSLNVYGGKTIYTIIRKLSSIGVLDKISPKEIISFLYIESYNDDEVIFVNITQKKRTDEKSAKENEFYPAVLRKNTLRYNDLLMDFDLSCLLDDRDTMLIFPTGNFLTYSSFLETLAFHLCSIYGVANYNHLFLRQNRYAKLEQARRIDKINEICKNSCNDMAIIEQELNEIKSLQYISEIRNQIAHNFLPGLIIYKEKAYYTTDKELYDILVKAIKSTTDLLIKYYMKEQDRFMERYKDDICKEFMIDFDINKRLVFQRKEQPICPPTT